MSDKLQETVDRENALHGETLGHTQTGGAAADAAGKDAATGDEKHEELKRRIAAGSQHHGDTVAHHARDAASTLGNFAREHPVATVLGGLAVGLLIGSMTPAGRRVRRRAGGLASSASEAAIGFAMGLIDDAADAARHGKDALVDTGERVGLGLREARRSAEHYARSASDRAGVTSRSAGRALSRRLRDL
ncbi:hypothetical protein EYB45_06420 [Erythrobacteraceae bacterium CFH 75059]|uniref:hypothetical protein n=1 Tax=Qipengyuania thermophila TaxID=2509361 RepID=UPI001020048A|nr:hypothetical protein [Qipengyuania thermophila]TCD05135.1 hypothetical protein EYB45_06420 [Erythrobacteraceae bacterium CFH 75059]